jgi:hypothetical protein
VITLLLCTVLACSPPPADLNDSIALLDRLDETLISVDYDDESIRGVIEDLNTRLPAQVWADWKSLERIGVYSDRRVTLRLNVSSASTVLSALTLIVGDELEKPVYEAHAGQIVLTTLPGSATLRVTAVYDVRELLANEALLKSLRDEIVLPAASPQDKPTVEPNGSEVADDNSQENPAAGPPPARPMTAGEKLLLFITDHVDPDAWINFGGNRGLITELDGVLMVTATPGTHRRLRSAIRSLQSAIPSNITFEAAIVDLPRAKLQSLTRQSAGEAASLVRSILLDSEAKCLWQTSDAVAVNQPLLVESASPDQSVSLSLGPNFDQSTGTLRVDVNATIVQGADRRTLKTVAALASDSSATTLEMPGAKPGESIRLLVLLAHRR